MGKSGRRAPPQEPVPGYQGLRSSERKEAAHRRPPPQLWRSFSGLALAANPASTASSTPPREQEQVVGPGYFADRPSVPQITLLILKDETGYLASDYWLGSRHLPAL